MGRARFSGVLAAILATACGGGVETGGTTTTGSGGSTTTTAGTGGAAPQCPAQDEAHLFVDGAEVLPLAVIGGGTGSTPTESTPDEASLILSKTGPNGEQEAFVNLRALVVGAGVSLAQSSMEYRVYPPVDGGGPPSTDVTYAGAQLGGKLDVAAIAVNPGDVICGTFDLTGHDGGQGTPSVRITGGFHHVWTGPTPGGG